MSREGNSTRLSVSTRSNQRKISECSDTSEDGRPQFFIGSFDEREKNIKETRRSLKNGSVKKLKDKPVIIESNNSPHKNNVENDVKVSSQTADVVVKEQENKITSTKDNVHSTDFDVDPEDPIYKTPEIEEFDENARIPKDVSSQTLKQDDFKYHESDIAIEDDTPVQHQDGGGDQPSALNSMTSTEAMDHDNVIPAAGSTTDKEANRVAHTETVLRTDNQSQSDANSNSYISTDSTVLDGDITVSNSNIPRPDSLSLPKPLQFYERQKGEAEQGESLVSPTTTDSISSMTERLLQAATSTPLQDQGVLTKDGDMIEFVAEDLTEKIRMSSPLSKSAGKMGTVFPRLFAPYIPPPSLNHHCFSLTKVQFILYFMFNFTLFCPPPSLAANISRQSQRWRIIEGRMYY